MTKINYSNLTNVPLDVPSTKRALFLKNLKLITKDTGRLFVFAGDQRVEHLNDDFFGQDISAEDAQPEHMFKIAASSRIGAFATQLGYIARFGATYPNIPYIVKLNSKSNIVKETDQEPYSSAWYDVREVINFAKNSGLKIAAVGYTVYAGSGFEAAMLREAAQIIYQAHQAGLVAIIWVYPRGKSVTDKMNAHTIAGAVNIGSALGADFVKVNQPEPNTPHGLSEIMLAGQRTGVLFAGGEATSYDELLQNIYANVHRFGSAGAALGRNIHQRSFQEAVALANAVASVVYDGQAPEVARRLLVKQ
ncbi:MAG: aldolase [Candidatus Falkowbacteria bacterium]|nr:aldolase [Candidatus Falkowbacteria bacterium]